MMRYYVNKAIFNRNNGEGVVRIPPEGRFRLQWSARKLAKEIARRSGLENRSEFAIILDIKRQRFLNIYAPPAIAGDAEKYGEVTIV